MTYSTRKSKRNCELGALGEQMTEQGDTGRENGERFDKVTGNKKLCSVIKGQEI